MKRSILILLILIILPIFTGCKSGDNPHTPAKAVLAQRGGVTVPEGQALDISEDTGVINNTTADVFKEPDTQSERVTQVIFNQPANILEQKDNWVRVKVVDGYTGWIKSKYIDKDCSGLKKENFEFRIVVTAKTKKIYSMMKGGITLKDVVMGTELYCRNMAEDQYEVALPGKVNGWISESGTMKISPDDHIPKTTALDFVMTANKLKGTTYLWGGVSYWGIDCSGLTYICGRMNGVDLPRDADQQFQCGEPVTGGIDSMKPGDLLFFSSNEGQKDITHVGIYTGNKQFINASQSKGMVTVGSLDENYYSKRLVGVKRIF